MDDQMAVHVKKSGQLSKFKSEVLSLFHQSLLTTSTEWEEKKKSSKKYPFNLKEFWTKWKQQNASMYWTVRDTKLFYDWLSLAYVFTGKKRWEKIGKWTLKGLKDKPVLKNYCYILHNHIR